MPSRMAGAWLLPTSTFILLAWATGVVTEAPISAPTSPDSDASKTCPLTFRRNDSSIICAARVAGYYSCCHLSIARSMSENSNITGRLYLDPADAAACKAEYEKNILGSLASGKEWCPSIDASFMAVSTVSCHFPYLDNLTNLVDTNGLIAACPNKRLTKSECDKCGSQILALAQNSDCIVASQIFIAAANTSLLYWRILTACIQNQFAVPIPAGLLAPEISPSPSPPAKKEGHGNVVAIAATVPTILVLAFIVLVMFLWSRSRRKSFSLSSMRSVRLAAQKGIREVRLAELRAATNNFAEHNKIGKGGSSDVYKGVLADGTVVAVKKLLREGRHEGRQFINEMQMYGNLHHPNLAELYGFCQEDREMILVQEYMANGSLEDVLFGDDSNVDLTWEMCMNIVMGVARGLAYLHGQVSENGHDRIIHRDIKPGNVLLDENFNVRLADFGVAKSLTPHQTHVTTKVMGTFGYLAPEYASSGKLTDKSDVYSFGVLLLVTLSKRQPASEEIATLQPGLVAQSFSLARESRTLQLVSLTYRGQFTPEQAERMVLVGLLCVQPEPLDRPTMSQVVLMLEGRMDVPDVPVPSHHSTSSIPGMRRVLGTNDGGTSTIHTSSLETDSRQFSFTSQGTTDWNSGEVSRDGEVIDRHASGRYL